jgi:hypothetical protein
MRTVGCGRRNSPLARPSTVGRNGPVFKPQRRNTGLGALRGSHTLSRCRSTVCFALPIGRVCFAYPSDGVFRPTRQGRFAPPVDGVFRPTRPGRYRHSN